MHRIVVLAVSWMLVPWTLQACGLGEETAEGYENASVEHAFQHWRQGASSAIPFFFLDVRTPEEFAAGHIPGAVNIPLQMIEKRLREIPRDRRLYVYCEAGVRSARAARLLRKAGYENIENITDGMRGWREHGYPQER